MSDAAETTRPAIDLNLDGGEDPGALRDGSEALRLEVVTSVNVACGGHAGDDETMAATVRLAAARGVAVGAHPSYPDRARFGRVAMDFPPDVLEATVGAQIARLGLIARGLGVEIRHVKPHGALYHAAGRDEAVALAVARASAAWSPGLRLVAAASSPALAIWRAMGFAVGAEAFADRAYERDGSLRSRSLPGALVLDPAEAAARAVSIALGRGVPAVDGTVLPLVATTIGLHGDTPGATAIARAVREGLEAVGVRVRSQDNFGQVRARE